MAALLITHVLLASAQSPPNANASKEEWEVLFNGKDLNGWTPKVATHKYGVNVGNTFRVEDGLLKVRYDQYKSFDGQFGHLFYEKPFSYYRLLVEYRFVGEQAPGHPGAWALRNSGAMLHSPDPRTMLLEQSFPISIEAQFVGGNGDGKSRSTANLCTPGTDVVFNGKIYVRPDAQKTNAFQSNRNILLSDDAKVNTKPQLEIWADDVKCSHGCTTGQLDEEALFYLQSRGIPKAKAKAMLLYAFAGELIEAVNQPMVKQYLVGIVRERLMETS